MKTTLNMCVCVCRPFSHRLGLPVSDGNARPRPLLLTKAGARFKEEEKERGERGEAAAEGPGRARWRKTATKRRGGQPAQEERRRERKALPQGVPPPGTKLGAPRYSVNTHKPALGPPPAGGTKTATPLTPAHSHCMS